MQNVRVDCAVQEAISAGWALISVGRRTGVSLAGGAALAERSGRGVVLGREKKKKNLHWRLRGIGRRHCTLMLVLFSYQNLCRGIIYTQKYGTACCRY